MTTRGRATVREARIVPPRGRVPMLLLLVLTACSGKSPADTDTGAPADTDTSADTDSATDTDADTGCTPEGEPLLGEARILCAAGTLEASGACTVSEAYTVRDTLTCDAYAGHGSQVLDTEVTACMDASGAECCECYFELDATCEPCAVND